MNVVCFGLSLPVEIVLPTTCNVLLTAFFLLILLQNVRPFFLLTYSTLAIYRQRYPESISGTHPVMSQSLVIQSVTDRYRNTSNALLPQSLSLEICGTVIK